MSNQEIDMTKLEAKVVVAALVWHAKNTFECRPLHKKQDKALRIAAINLLKKQDDDFTVKRLQIAKRR
jgi:hypothetical protein